MIPFRGSAEILGRLELSTASRALLVGAPPELEAMVAGGDLPAEAVATKALRTVNDRFDFILLWQEDRVGSQAVLDAARKRLLPGGRLWVATAMKKVQGPRTPSAHRLNRDDLTKAFAKDGLSCDREVRLSAWHTAYRFTRFVGPDSEGPGGR